MVNLTNPIPLELVLKFPYSPLLGFEVGAGNGNGKMIVVLEKLMVLDEFDLD